MSVTLAEARKQLREVADELEALRFRLLGIQGSLPEPSAEKVRFEELDGMDAATELRAVIGCVLNDFIGSAIRDLRDAVTETEGGGRDEKRDPPA